MNDRAITERAEIIAFARLAHTLSRISVRERNWAHEAERQNKPAQAQRWRDEAARKRDNANWYLQKAKDRAYG